MQARAFALSSLVLFAACDRQDSLHVETPPAEALAVTPAGATPVAATSAETQATLAAQVSGSSACRALPPGVEDLSPILEPLRARLNLPALAAAVVTADGPKGIGVVGVRRYGDPTPACVGDAFQLASNAKALTAVVIAKAVEQGRLSWSTTIGEAFSDVTGRNRAYDGVTLDLLMAHRAGFAHNPKSMSLDELKGLPGATLHDQREAYARVVLRETPINTPGTQYSYSNTDYTLAGLMAERKTGQSFEDLLRLEVFQPLGMAGAGFGPSSGVNRVEGPWPHVMNGSPTPLVPDQNAINPLYRTPAGNVHVPMAAWARFAQDMLRSLEGKGELLSAATYQRIHTPTFGGEYSYGWHVVRKDWTGGVAYTHNGTDLRNISLAWVVPQRRVAFLMATNVGKVKGPLREVLKALRQRVPGCEGSDDDVPDTIE
jgi:CubicO group peptidase (beta-lactamase class C family)